MIRPNNDERIMMHLDLESRYTTCYRGGTAAALVDYYGSTLITGRNGVPRNAVHCIDMPNTGERCVRCIHGERNVLNHAARTGTSTHGKIMYVLHRPCVACTNDIIATGLIQVRYRWDYNSDGQLEYVRNLLHENNIKLIKVEYTIQEAQFNEMLNALCLLYGLPNPLAESK